MKSPTMLYRSPGAETIWGVSVDCIIVDECDVEAHEAQGWNRTVPGAEQDAQDRAAAQLAANEAEQARIAQALRDAGEDLVSEPPKLRAVHKGRGVYELHDEAGNVVASGLTKDEAQAKAG